MLDWRILPGFDADDLVREVRDLLGPDSEVRVESFEPCPFRFDRRLGADVAYRVPETCAG